MRALWLPLLLLAACDGSEPPARLSPPTEPAPSPTLDATWIGEADGDAPLVVLLHGYGAPGDDLVPLGRSVHEDLGVRVAAPVAPIEMGPRARAWWRIELAARPADRGDAAPAGLIEARHALGAWLVAQRDAGRLDPNRTVLAGFSQGAMLSAEAALRGPVRPAGIAMLSGGPIAEAGWIRALGASPAPPVFISHGRQDGMLAYPAAERLVERFRAAGADVTFTPFDGGHQIPPVARAGFVRWLRQTLRLGSGR